MSMSSLCNSLRWIAVLVAIASLSFAQQNQTGLEQARERWERMTPAERVRIAERFAEFRELPQAERERMAAHLRRVDEVRREIEAGIPDELRATLETLEPAARRLVLREYVESALGERAERLRNKMSPELLRQLESATPAEREQLLRARREELREEGAPQLLHYLAKKQNLPPEEVARLQALPRKEMLAALEQLGRSEIERRGPPPGVNDEEFARWLKLPPHELMERMQRSGGCGFRGRRDFDGPPDARQGSGERERGFERWKGEGRPDSNRGPRRESRLSRDAQVQVFSALRPQPEWIVELASEAQDVRREEIGRRVRVKVVEVLLAQPQLDAQEIAALELLEGREVFEALREIVGDPPAGFGERFRSGARGGPGRGNPEEHGGPPPHGGEQGPPPPPPRRKDHE
jgi:hypothetical protein